MTSIPYSIRRHRFRSVFCTLVICAIILGIAAGFWW